MSFLFITQGKTKCNSVLIILRPASLLMGIHDSFYNRKPYSAAAIFPGSGFIYFIEFDPDLIQFILRNRLPCIKYGSDNHVFFFPAGNLYDMFVFQMI